MSGLSARLKFSRSGFGLDLDLELPERGVTALLGPSGGGKSTLLRLLAGLERPQAGFIRCLGEAWFDAGQQIWLPAEGRRVGMLFQDYALFPHLNALENVAFGLRGRDRLVRARDWLARLHLADFARRHPQELSGGQRQRVALARALAREPRLLLLDEPLSAIDAHLRRRLQEYLREDLATLGIPVLLVTHDLAEARVLGDQLGILADGRLRQFGSPAEVFAQPTDRACAEILGWQNFLPVANWQGCRASGDWGRLQVAEAQAGRGQWLGIRPESIRVASGPGSNHLSAQLLHSTDFGDHFETLWQIGSLRLLARQPTRISHAHTWLALPEQALLVFSED
ncbi:ABC transporter ATP-binding protein [Thermithiobacillus plumbiphilus]|uniref:ABC transporter ATP-binding protein n=1 Tax=Thermithiobacillus plumbiphilus TaxID=1729899 RepID=A0ABU9D6B0_9PROT